MTATGSLPEGQELFRCEAKPQDRFRDRASTPLMTGNGWETEGRLSPSSRSCHADNGGPQASRIPNALSVLT